MVNLSNATETFKVLSDPTRLRIIRLLLTHKTEICVCEFVDSLREQQYNISKHIKLLEASGLIQRRKESRWIYYFISKELDSIPESLFEMILGLPDSDGQFGRDQGRFEARLNLRENGKCQVGIQDSELVAK